jgi:magnesium-transporting ATPase (P-type)
MGIETDWNCAISLRPLESDGPDPHRMTSNYSDWDVKARLPHGVEAIKRHLQDVDNVPLLVSLYTDSTTETISEMISIFQENDEVVMGVGSSLKASNAALFAKADISVALQTGLYTLFDEQLPRGTQAPVFSQDDVDFSHLLNTLACSFSIQSSSSSSSRSSGDATLGLPQLMELIRLGRSTLTNFHQMIAFVFVSQLFLATLIVATYIVPFPFVPQLSCGSIFWFLWVLVPALSLSMLASPEEKDVMKRTPRKNEAISLTDSDSDLPRLAWYFVLRHLPSVVVAILVYESIFGFSLEANRSTLDESYRSYRWIDFVLHESLTQERPRPRAVAAAIDRAEAAMIFLIGISVIASSTSYMYRCESIFVASPLRNRIWTVSATMLVGVQLVISVGCAGLSGSDGMRLSTFAVHAVPWYFWCGLLSWPAITLVVDEVVKSHDRHHLTRYYRFLRMQFDTRLGMWSPK